MKGCVQMFLSIKKLTIKITAVVATVLLITGATFGIKKCCNKTPKRVAVDTNSIHVEEPSNEVIPSTHAFRNVGALNHNQEAAEVINSVEIPQNRGNLNPTPKNDDTVTTPTGDSHAETSSSESESYHSNPQD